MKHFKVPVGKIAAVITGASGIVLGECILANNKKHHPGTKGTFAGILGCSTVESICMHAAIKLWKASDANMEIRILNQNDLDRMFNEQLEVIIGGFSVGASNKAETINRLIKFFSEYKGKLSMSTVIYAAAELFNNDRTESFICDDNSELCKALIQLRHASTTKSRLYDGTEDPAKACKMYAAMHLLTDVETELFVETNNTTIHDELYKFIDAEHTTLDEIVESCSEAESLIAGNIPDAEDKTLDSLLTKVTGVVNVMDVRSNLAAACTDFITSEITTEVAAIVFYSARRSNPKGFELFVKTFPNLYEDVIKELAPKYLPSINSLGVLVTSSEHLLSAMTRFRIECAEFAAYVIYAENVDSASYDEKLQQLENRWIADIDDDVRRTEIATLRQLINNEHNSHVK